MQKPNKCFNCRDEIPNGSSFCKSCMEKVKEFEDFSKRACEWINGQYDIETLSYDEYARMRNAYVAGAFEYRYKFRICEDTLPF